MATKRAAETALEVADADGGQRDEDGALVNIGAMHEAIRNAFHERDDIEREIKRLNDIHIKPLKDRRTKLMRQLKADTKITQKLLNAQYAQFKIAADAEDLEGDQRDKVFDDLRELHAALHPGQTVDWLEAIKA